MQFPSLKESENNRTVFSLAACKLIVHVQGLKHCSLVSPDETAAVCVCSILHSLPHALEARQPLPRSMNHFHICFLLQLLLKVLYSKQNGFKWNT